MYEYKFVDVNIGAFSNYPKEDYHEIIHEHAKQGWKLHQIFTPPFATHGQAITMELIFERKI